MSRVRQTNIFFMVLLASYVGGSLGISFLSNYIAIPKYVLLGSSQFLLFIPSVIYFVLSKDLSLSMIRQKRLSIDNILLVILLAYLSMPLITMLNILSMQLSENRVNTMMLEMMENPYWVNLLFVAVLPAFFEEFIFRGIIFHSYRKAGILKGAIYSGILFGLVHLNLNQFSYAFAMGIIFALLIEATGSIFAPIIFHFIINGHSITLATLAIRLMSPEELALAGEIPETQMLGLSSESMWILILMGIILVFTITFLAVLVYIWIAKRSGRLYHVKSIFQKTEEKKERIMDIPLLIGIIACILFIIITEIG